MSRYPDQETGLQQPGARADLLDRSRALVRGRRGGGTNGQLTRERESSSERVSVDGGERPGRRRCGMACGIPGLQ